MNMGESIENVKMMSMQAYDGFTQENYLELKEAVYFFNRMYSGQQRQRPYFTYTKAIKAMGINESVWHAALKILVTNALLMQHEHHYCASPETVENLLAFETQVAFGSESMQTVALFDKASDKTQFFFNSLSDLEYDIYSRCDFEVTFKLGREVGKYIELKNTRVLELGGNSGGLAAALLSQNGPSYYTVVDLPIPCKVGRELNQSLNKSLEYIDNDVFHLDLPNTVYDHILAVNFLHDFDDAQCLQILNNCAPYTKIGTRFTVIEDLLESDFEPKNRIMHGLRLAAECRGGKQRTAAEMAALFKLAGYSQVSTSIINAMHTYMTFEK